MHIIITAMAYVLHISNYNLKNIYIKKNMKERKKKGKGE
jgi:hypothetical protein